MKKIIFIVLCCMLASCGEQIKKKSPIAVMSFNVRYDNPGDGDNAWGNRKEAVVKMIETVRPDIIGMQEVLTTQNDYLAENLSGYELIGVGRDDGALAGEFMTILFDKERYDAIDAGHFWLSETPGEPSKGWDGACNRMATWVELQEKGSERVFWFFNTHLDHMGPQARQEGVKLLVRKIDEIAGKGTVFVTGDFNAMPQDAVLQPMFVQFGSARDNAPETDSYGTFNGFGTAPNSIIIDYIFYRNATPLKFRTVNENYGVPSISDHYPVVANLEF